MRERTLVLHIGMQKTGSTSIQHMLGALSRRLRRVGVDIPKAGFRNGNHNDLFRRAVWSDGRTWPALADEMSRSRSGRFVVSADVFSGPRGVARAAELVPRVEELAEAADLAVTVVAYVRPQYQFIESYYAERVKVGAMTDTFHAALPALLAAPGLDYGSVFAPWREAFGRVIVTPLEVAREHGGLLPHFLKLIGAEALTRKATRLSVANKRPGAKALEILRLTAIELADRSLDRKAVASLLAPVRQELPSLLDWDIPFAGLSREQARAVTAQWREANSKLGLEETLGREPDDIWRPAMARASYFCDEERARVRAYVGATGCQIEL